VRISPDSVPDPDDVGREPVEASTAQTGTAQTGTAQAGTVRTGAPGGDT